VVLQSLLVTTLYLHPTTDEDLARSVAGIRC